MSGSSGAIAIANYDFSASGTVAKSIQIARALADAGAPVELWAVRAEGPLRHRADGLTVVEVGSPAPASADRTGALLAAVPRLAEAVRARRPAVLLSGGKHFHLAARLALALSGRRRLTAFGGRASNSAWRPGTSDLQDLASDAALRFKYGDMDFVVAVCDELARELAAKVPRIASRTTTIFNGVNRAAIRAAAAEPFASPFDCENGAALLVAMGRVKPQKGFDLLIDALVVVNRVRPARLLIVGDGSKRAIRALRDLADARGVGDRVRFTGYLDNPFAAIAGGDLFVCASRWEGASNALIEALACGLPLVATDCPTGNREILDDGRCGTLACAEDPAALARAILTELETPRSRDAQRAASIRYELDACLGAYAELLAAQRARMI